MTPVWIAAALWLVTLLVAVHVYRHHHRSKLTYDYQLPQPKGFTGLTAAVGRSFEAMAWGSSYATWKARCEASLKASRRRRGVEA